MSYTRAQLRTQVLSWLDDPNAGYFTPSEVNTWLNNAQRELQKRLIDKGENFYIERMSGSTVLNVDTYTLPTDFKKCHKLEVVITGTGVNEQRRTITPVTYVQLDQMARNTGVPTVMCLKGNQFILRPIPDAVYTIYLHQSYQVADMSSDSDVPDCPSDYMEYIAIRAALDGFMKDQREPSAFVLNKKQEFEAMLEKDAQKRDVSAPRFVVSTQDQSYGALY